MKPKLFLLCGPIGCGKSTWAKEASKIHDDIIINDDTLITMYHGEYGRYNKENKAFYKAAEHSLITLGLLAGKNVIVDRTSPQLSTREFYWKLGSRMNAEKILVLWEFVEPVVSAKARFCTDARGLCFQKWLEVANFHLSQYDKPEDGEGYHKIINIERIYE